MKFSAKEKNRMKEKYGSWAVVTGASSGIGYELALRLAEAGINLLINARNELKLEEIRQDFQRRFAVQVLSVPGDVSSEDTINTIIESSKNLEVGLLIVSAGFGTSGEFINNSIEAEKSMLRVNCEALLILTHHFSKVFVQHKRGGIILMSSMVAFQGVPHAANYAATKAYVQSLAEALAIELKPLGVDILAAAPGPVKSGFGQRADMKMGFSLTPEQIGAPILKALGRKTTVLPGTLTKFLVYSLMTVPRRVKVLIMNKVMGNMTRHQAQST
ncbi:SDR family NAD(P)-dependent oxidoreductase [Emticicia agri]|uniref:NADP-dependent 3-hydroxy acid dehydrogenase YdfG n=1 Tax=Emticicia agri TaxID=2492393 RepID=A0A4Q5LUM1_9BACT|nr:SDR family NAD(P)-dependent oxidoreductase [Emticicia agri]RYU93378.1 SDR family NAD(P)-dependent oxidoreductase [Emticicia agri]